MKRFFCVVDTETGGIDPRQHSLLTVAWTILDYRFEQVSPYFHFPVKPPNENYKTTPKALEINQIDIIKHSKEAVPFHTIMKTMHDHQLYTKDPKATIILTGQNIKFDAEFLSAQDDDFLKPFERYFFDISNIAMFIQSLGLIPEERISLEAQAKTLEIVNDNPHNALEDVKTEVKILQKYRKIVASAISK